MKKSIFAVCDPEADYAYNFMGYLNQKNNIPFELQMFTGTESLIAFGRKERIELLLISEKVMCREIQELDIGRIIILSEGMQSPELEAYPSVYKYQASSSGGDGMLRRRDGYCSGSVSGIEEDYGDIGSVFSGRPMSENIFCINAGTGACQKACSFISQSGRICRV